MPSIIAKFKAAFNEKPSSFAQAKLEGFEWSQKEQIT